MIYMNIYAILPIQRIKRMKRKQKENAAANNKNNVKLQYETPCAVEKIHDERSSVLSPFNKIGESLQYTPFKG